MSVNTLTGSVIKENLEFTVFIGLNIIFFQSMSRRHSHSSAHSCSIRRGPEQTCRSLESAKAPLGGRPLRLATFVYYDFQRDSTRNITLSFPDAPCLRRLPSSPNFLDKNH